MIRLFFIFSLFVVPVLSQPIYTQKDVDICKSKFELGVNSNLESKPINDVVAAIGKSFIGLPYESHTLDKGKDENLIIHLTGLDCYTFLESSLVFARCLKENNPTFSCYKKELENIRYRNGKLNGYTSRLHYFSDWVYDMNKRGIAEDITKEIGGIPYHNNVDFMSTHPDSYKQLKDNNANINKMKEIEKKISKRHYYYIPQESIQKIEKRIKSGDIIGITTNIGGLDISHTGIAIRYKDGRIHLMHAPNVGEKVQISKEPLAQYIQLHKYQTGIMVVRPLEPKQ